MSKYEKGVRISQNLNTILQLSLRYIEFFPGIESQERRTTVFLQCSNVCFQCSNNRILLLTGVQNSLSSVKRWL